MGLCFSTAPWQPRPLFSVFVVLSLTTVLCTHEGHCGLCISPPSPWFLLYMESPGPVYLLELKYFPFQVKGGSCFPKWQENGC